MRQLSCILQIALTGAPRLFAADNVLSAVQTAGGWLLTVPKAPEGYSWRPEVAAMNPDALTPGASLTVLAEGNEIEIATDDAPRKDFSLFVSATLRPHLPRLVLLFPGSESPSPDDTHPEHRERP